VLKSFRDAVQSSDEPAGSFAHVAESFAHAVQSFAHVAESFAHAAQSFAHAAQSFAHVAESFAHVAESFAHVAESSDHAVQSFSAPAKSLVIKVLGNFEDFLKLRQYLFNAFFDGEPGVFRVAPFGNGFALLEMGELLFYHLDFFFEFF